MPADRPGAERKDGACGGSGLEVESAGREGREDAGTRRREVLQVLTLAGPKSFHSRVFAPSAPPRPAVSLTGIPPPAGGEDAKTSREPPRKHPDACPDPGGRRRSGGCRAHRHQRGPGRAFRGPDSVRDWSGRRGRRRGGVAAGPGPEDPATRTARMAGNPGLAPGAAGADPEGETRPRFGPAGALIVGVSLQGRKPHLHHPGRHRRPDRRQRGGLGVHPGDGNRSRPPQLGLPTRLHSRLPLRRDPGQHRDLPWIRGDLQPGRAAGLVYRAELDVHARRLDAPDRKRLVSLGLRSEEHTSELQSQSNLVCRLLLEKKKAAYWLMRSFNSLLTIRMARYDNLP